ncbi:hypothetical protein H8Z72_22680 (plasmid) [Xanthomonas citri pv. citri]|uniref:hypothetical protein n=1 Tax=Xanthomonas citri TaxID=346 RepID=UPI00193222F5|nr:hypothetical protein [Xanthomonas citri]QRD71756.1 hypothetical protein H8Z72_22680 [Xanthomonas citri pv. citri]
MTSAGELPAIIAGVRKRAKCGDLEIEQIQFLESLADELDALAQQEPLAFANQDDPEDLIDPLRLQASRENNGARGKSIAATYTRPLDAGPAADRTAQVDELLDQVDQAREFVKEAVKQRDAAVAALEVIAQQGPIYGPDGTRSSWRHWTEIAREALGGLSERGNQTASQESDVYLVQAVKDGEAWAPSTNELQDVMREAQRWRLVAELFDGATTGRSERILEDLRLPEGEPWRPFGEIVDAAIADANNVLPRPER